MKLELLKDKTAEEIEQVGYLIIYFEIWILKYYWYIQSSFI